MELISIYSLTNHSQKKLGNFISGKNQLLIGKSPNFTSQNQLKRKYSAISSRQQEPPLSGKI